MPRTWAHVGIIALAVAAAWAVIILGMKLDAGFPLGWAAVPTALLLGAALRRGSMSDRALSGLLAVGVYSGISAIETAVFLLNCEEPGCP